MAEQKLEYGQLVENALRRVIHDALAIVAERGLPGRHHLYITFRSGAPGVQMPDGLRARYPNEMTIVLQHEFWGLEVDDAGFGVTLSFNALPQRIEVPFEAVTVFADPSVEFGLQFQGAAAQELESEEAPVADLGRSDSKKGAPVSEIAQARTDEQKEADGTAEVVTLDQFRKK